MASSWFRRSLLFMYSYVSLIHSFRKLSISITVPSDSSSYMFSSSSTGKSSTIYSFVGGRPSNIASFLEIITYRTLSIGKVSVLCVTAALSELGSWLAAFRKCLKKGALDLISSCFVSKLDINADLLIHTWEHKQLKCIIQDFSIALLRAYPFCFLKTALFPF